MEAELGSAGVDGLFDLEATIAEFVRDETRTSLELPRTLSAEQRKIARSLADRHLELKCHSYGIGIERQLHLFKKDVGRAGAPTSNIGVIGGGRSSATNAVRVKNTFIDDWVGGEGSVEAEEPLVCRSLPAGSAPQSLFLRAAKEGRLDLAPVVEGSGPRKGVVEEPILVASPESSACHDAGYVTCSSPGGSSVPSAPELPASLPPLPEGLKVSMRNTFIHIESVPEVERIVQSMPDGMFRQCLDAEVAVLQGIAASGSEAIPLGSGDDGDTAEAPRTGYLLAPVGGASPSPLSYSPAAMPNCPPPVAEPAMLAGQFLAGAQVIVQGLVKLPAWNGLTGVVQSLDVASGRYDVVLADPGTASGWRWVKVKGDNLILQDNIPPPPCNAPTILLEDPANSSPLKLNALV